MACQPNALPLNEVLAVKTTAQDAKSGTAIVCATTELDGKSAQPEESETVYIDYGPQSARVSVSVSVSVPASASSNAQGTVFSRALSKWLNTSDEKQLANYIVLSTTTMPSPRMRVVRAVAPHASCMAIHVSIMSRILDLSVESCDSVVQVKRAIELDTGIDAEIFTLSYNGRVLHDDKYLHDYCIMKNAFLKAHLGRLERNEKPPGGADHK